MLSVSLLLLFALSALCHVSCSDSSPSLTRSASHAWVHRIQRLGTGGALSRIAEQPMRNNWHWHSAAHPPATTIPLSRPANGTTMHATSTGEVSAGIAVDGFARTTHSALSDRRCNIFFHRAFLLQEACCRSKLPLQILSHCVDDYILYPIILFSTSHLC